MGMPGGQITPVEHIFSLAVAACLQLEKRIVVISYCIAFPNAICYNVKKFKIPAETL